MELSELKGHVVKLRCSDTASFKAIVEHFHKSLFNFLLFRVNDIAIAEDLLQETFTRLWENRQTLDENLSLKSFLFTTASNLTLNHFRHEKVVYNFRQNREHHHRVLSETPYSELEYRELQHIVLDAIAEMSEKVRMTFLLSKIEGLSYKEIAERMGVTTATVESHMVKALALMRKKLESYKNG
jgi:RNA polymerase sigma-70 factor (family 1)